MAAANLPPDRIAFLGFGLIGGSIARALRSRGSEIALVAWTPDLRGPRAGLADGTLNAVAASPADALADADLVVLAGPAPEVIRTLTDLGDVAGALHASLRNGATITDVASTKGAIVATAGAGRLPFVGGHPMAGRETSGYGAATADLFEGRPWVVVPSDAAGEADLARVEWLATTVGARPIRMTAASHDRAVAGISHLPLVLAAALVEAVAGPNPGGSPNRDTGPAPDGWPIARSLAATGWADMTRLARGDATMGAGILATNGAEVVGRLRDLRRVLDAWIDDLDRGTGTDAGASDRIRARLAAARAALDAPVE